ncbi:PadR family transcriptional regulator [candidate division KSB1 bacterium]
MKYITRKEELMLLAILKLGSGAYLVRLREFLNDNTEKRWTVGNVFVTLEKLEESDYIRSRIGEPTAKRGGKAIKYYQVTDSGREALRTVKTVQDEMWDGIYDFVFDNRGTS